MTQEPSIFTFDLIGESPKSWLVMDDCESCDKEIWLPKSQCRLISIDEGLITLEVPEWLARKRNL